MEDKNRYEIPYGKAVRVGNFKLWRGKYTIGQGKDRFEIDSIHVSNLDGSWMVRIPSTSQMYGTICMGYNTSEEELRNNFLGMILTNVYSLSTTASEALHDAFFFLHEMMTFPYLLLSEKEMRKRMEKGLKETGLDKDKRKEHISKMVEYRKQLYDLVEQKRDRLIEDYELQMAERQSKEDEEEKKMKQDELAEQAMDILNEDKGN